MTSRTYSQNISKYHFQNSVCIIIAYSVDFIILVFSLTRYRSDSWTPCITTASTKAKWTIFAFRYELIQTLFPFSLILTLDNNQIIDSLFILWYFFFTIDTSDRYQAALTEHIAKDLIEQEDTNNSNKFSISTDKPAATLQKGTSNASGSSKYRTVCLLTLVHRDERLCVFRGWTNVTSASSPFAQSFSHANAQQRSDNLPRRDDVPCSPEGGYVVFSML